MSVNVKEKPADFVVFDFFGRNFCHPPPHHYRRTFKFEILLLRQTFNLQKCWTKTQYCEFAGPATAMEGNWMTKIVAEKIEYKFSSMLDEDNIANSTALRLRWGKLGDKNRRRKNETDIFNFFSHDFCHPIFPRRNRRILDFAILCLRQTFFRIYSSQSQVPRIRNIASSSNSFENFKFSKLLMGEIGWRKSLPKKSKMSGRFFWLRFSLLNHPHTPPPSQSLQDPWWRMKIAMIKLKTSAWFFWPQFSSPSPHCNHRRILQFTILNLRQTFLGIDSSQYRIRGSRNCNGSEGNENAAKKIENVGRTLKKCLKCGRDKLPSLVLRHQAARPSRSPDLAGQVAVWTRLNILRGRVKLKRLIIDNFVIFA